MADLRALLGLDRIPPPDAFDFETAAGALAQGHGLSTAARMPSTAAVTPGQPPRAASSSDCANSASVSCSVSTPSRRSLRISIAVTMPDATALSELDIHLSIEGPAPPMVSGAGAGPQRPSPAPSATPGAFTPRAAMLLSLVMPRLLLLRSGPHTRNNAETTR